MGSECVLCVIVKPFPLMCLFAIIIPDQPLPPPTQCLTGRNRGDRVGGEHGDGEDSIATAT